MIPIFCRRSLASWVLWWAAQAARWWDAASQRLGCLGGSSPKLNEWCFCLPSGKRLHNYGKSSFLMGKITIISYVNVYQRVVNVREIHQLKTVVNPIGLKPRDGDVDITYLGKRWTKSQWQKHPNHAEYRETSKKQVKQMLLILLVLNAGHFRAWSQSSLVIIPATPSNPSIPNPLISIFAHLVGSFKHVIFSIS